MTPLPALDPILILARGLYAHPHLEPTFAHLAPARFYTCAGCGALFFPDDDGATTYLDRWGAFDTTAGHTIGPCEDCTRLPAHYAITPTGELTDTAGAALATPTPIPSPQERP